MWVEMLTKKIQSVSAVSSSSWGCELKYPFQEDYIQYHSHPPREDVSWNKVVAKSAMTEPTSSSSWGCELKYIRLPVTAWHTASSSSWGCELKYNSLPLLRTGSSHPPREDVSWNIIPFLSCAQVAVILLVRMWVEIRTVSTTAAGALSSSSWGCELKYSTFITGLIMFGHPPREDVSWNIASRIIEEAEKRSSSSWGCELKWSPVIPRDTSDKSSSSWRCELKYDCKRCHKSSYKLSCLWCLEYIGYSNKNCKVVYEVAI